LANPKEQQKYDKYKNNNISSSEKTEILYGEENAMHRLVKTMSRVKDMAYVCGDSLSPSFSMGVESIKKGYINFNKRGIKTKFITEITKDNIEYCKELMKFVELRHMDDVKDNIAVSETEYVATAVLQGPKSVTQTIYSNAKAIIDQNRYFFENLWNKSIPAEQKIREIEDGIELGTTEIITNSLKIVDLFIDLIKSSASELLLILPTVNAFIREYRLGIIQLMIKKAIEHNVKVNILMPIDNTIHNIIQNMMSFKNQEQERKKQMENFKIQTIKPTFEPTPFNTVTIIIADRKRSLVMEKKDDSKENFIDAVGLATYSTSKPTVYSYVSVFETIWNQTKLYYQLELANEQLKIHDKMQKEFINIASHEMKTPVQSILAFSELLQENSDYDKKMVQGIYRNAVRLQRLTNDILDVTKIESGTLKLNKKKFSIKELILSVIMDFENPIEKENNTVKIFTEFKKDFIIEADKGRIFQVMDNLLNNAIKFTNYNGIIQIKVCENVTNDHVIVSVKDNGIGIDKEILPRLFIKFVTFSTVGTGLGLYISKNIIEAHGGKIWAQNNGDGKKGATFSFSLPLIN
jgi:two-component system, OmpR family, sensor histidine kinase VicK